MNIQCIIPGKQFRLAGLSLLLLATLTTPLKAETYHLDLPGSIEIAQLKSYGMLSLKQDLRIAEFNLKSATARFRTHIDLNFVSPQYTETIRQYEDSAGISFYPIKQMNYQGNLIINQPLPTDGSIYIRSGLSNYDDYFSDFRSTYLNTRIGLSQPITSLYGYNSIKSSLKQAELAYERSNKELNREQLNLNYNVSSAFYDLLSVQKGAEIALANLDRQKEAYELAKNKYEAGLIKEVDALQMEVDLADAQNNYDMARINMSSSENRFKELIGIEFKDSVLLSTEFKYESILVDPEKAVELAMQNRLEIREQDIQTELNKLNLKRQKSEGMPQINLNAYYEKAGYSGMSGTNAGMTSSWNNTFKDFLNRPQNYGLGLSVSIPILDFGENKALVRAAEARLKQNLYRKEEVTRGIESEVRNLVAELNNSLSRLKLLEKNVLVAEKSFEITRQRFVDGDIDSQSLALERNRLNNAYTSHLRAYINYQLQLSNLTRKTFYDFVNDRPLN